MSNMATEDRSAAEKAAAVTIIFLIKEKKKYRY